MMLPRTAKKMRMLRMPENTSKERPYSSGTVPLLHIHFTMRHNLSETTELLRDRRSISPERYSSRMVHKEIVEQVLTNATWAPNHGLTQPWRFKAYVGEGMKRIGPKLAEWYAQNAGEQASPSRVAKLEARG